MQFSPSPSSTRGFTLIELMIVVVVVMTASGFGFSCTHY